MPKRIGPGGGDGKTTVRLDSAYHAEAVPAALAAY
jgi:hypothetical protein